MQSFQNCPFEKILIEKVISIVRGFSFTHVKHYVKKRPKSFQRRFWITPKINKETRRWKVSLRSCCTAQMHTNSGTRIEIESQKSMLLNRWGELQFVLIKQSKNRRLAVLFCQSAIHSGPFLSRTTRLMAALAFIFLSSATSFLLFVFFIIFPCKTRLYILGWMVWCVN